ncbi:TPA: hypothetical protein QDZ28_004248 [Pseudomonas putida]|nr:hypothetical protein [Pseudomonas putida]
MKGNEGNPGEPATLALLQLGANVGGELGTATIELCSTAAEALQRDAGTTGEGVAVELISRAHYNQVFARNQALEADIADMRENLATVLRLHLAVCVASVASMLKNDSTSFAVMFGGHIVSFCDDEGSADRLASDLRRSLSAGLSGALNDSRCSTDVSKSRKIEIPASALDPAKW